MHGYITLFSNNNITIGKSAQGNVVGDFLKYTTLK